MKPIAQPDFSLILPINAIEMYLETECKINDLIP
jgi:hypothetical protein